MSNSSGSAPLVTVITATTGADYFRDNVESVAAQTYPHVQHLVVVDGALRHAAAQRMLLPNDDVIVLPYATGLEGYNGHLIYAACTFLARGDYLIFLDEDNWLDPDHVEALVEVATPRTWAFSFRKIVDMGGAFLCNDDCESLGNWPSCIGETDYLVDVNCFLLPKRLAITVAPLWYRRHRHPDDGPDVDRLITQVLRSRFADGRASGKYSVNYRAGNNAHSVTAAFFADGNKAMLERHRGRLPWCAES